MAERRVNWPALLEGVSPGSLVFLDECGVRTDLTRTYARRFDGARIVEAVPHAKWTSTTVLSALRLDGTTRSWSVDGSTDEAVFLAYMEHVLLPGLRPGDVVVMDNLSSHKTEAVQAAFALAGVRVEYLPPYSPDFNPIEKMWSKLKSILRKLKARTAETLEQALGQALKAVTAEDAEGWFDACGYRYTHM